MTEEQTMYHEDDAPYERFGELTVQDLIDLLNRRVTFRKEQAEPTPGRKMYTDLQIRAKGSEQELHHLLDRITAHKMNIRAITND